MARPLPLSSQCTTNPTTAVGFALTPISKRVLLQQHQLKKADEHTRIAKVLVSSDPYDHPAQDHMDTEHLKSERYETRMWFFRGEGGLWESPTGKMGERPGLKTYGSWCSCES